MNSGMIDSFERLNPPLMVHFPVYIGNNQKKWYAFFWLKNALNSTTGIQHLHFLEYAGPESRGYNRI
jgi:hypothetical protein